MKKVFFIAVIFAFIGFILNAQINTWHFNSASIEDGLSGSQNEFIYTDSRGFTWISATNAGLNRFDGHTYKIYSPTTPLDSSSIPNNLIQSDFIEDSLGNIAFSIYGPLVIYQRKFDNFKSFQLPQNPANGKPFLSHSLSCKDKNGTFWSLLGMDKVYSFNPRTEQWHFQFSLKKKAHRLIPVFSKAQKLIGFFAYSRLTPGLFFYKKDKTKKFDLKFNATEKLPPFSAPVNVREIYVESDTCAWIATEKGLLKINPLLSSCIQIKNLENISLKSIKPLASHSLIFATENFGLITYNKASQSLNLKFAPIKNSPQFLSGSPEWIRNDYLGNYWIATAEKGVYYTTPKNAKFKTFSLKNVWKNIESSIGVNSFSEDIFGNIWCTTKTSGIFVFSKKMKPLYRFHKDGKSNFKIKGDNIWQMFSDSQGRMWTITGLGINLIKPTKNSFKVIENDFQAICGLELHDGRILFSGINGGIFQAKEEDGEINFKKLSSQSVTGSFISLFQCNNGLLLAEKDLKSLEIFNITPFDSLKRKSSLPIEGIGINFYEENDTCIWITNKLGLIKLNPSNSKFEIIPIKSEFQSIDLKGILGLKNKSGSTNAIWLTTNRGVARYLPASESFSFFNSLDGLNSSEFNLGAIIQLSNGEVWMGGKNGISYFHPDSFNLLKTIPNVHLTKVYVNDKESDNIQCKLTGATNITEVKKLVFPSDQKTISFDFVAIDYADPKSTQLKYKLENYDKTWVTEKKGKQGFARYAQLPHGKYIFKIKAANSDGVWSEKVKSVEIVILPHFTETLGFQFFLLFAIGLIGYFIYRNRIRRIKEKAELSTRISENKMAALRAQMNPHFIFNSLNSINSYILSNNVAQASRYVGKFANLMRLILDLSRYKTIALEKEVEMLKLYMDVERLRFKKPFDYRFEIDDDVDEFDTEIPTMILQPFVENSIWHGLAPKEEDQGFILIKISNGKNALKCTIEDNGVGRKRAAEIKKQKGRAHKSRALDIVKERLSILQKEEVQTHRIEIEDLFDKHGTAAGTRIKISLPMIFD